MIALKVTYSGAVPGIARKELGRIKKLAYEAAGIWWHQKARPVHFTQKAKRLYGYAPRKGESGNPHPKGFKRSYTGQKLKTMGHTLPLVYTGTGRALSRMRDVRSTARGVRVVLHAPGFNRRHPKSKIDMVAELTELTGDDEKAAARAIDYRFDLELATIRTTATKTF